MRYWLLVVLLLSAASALASDPFYARSAVYHVQIDDGRVMKYGTGILIDRDKILTNCHVLNLAGGRFTVTHGQTGATYQPKLYYSLGNYDACVLKGYFPDGNPVPIADKFTLGQDVWFYGFPAGMSADGHGPILRTINTDQGTVIEAAAYCKPGSSGGPLFNAAGELVGLNYATRTLNNQAFCLSIPAFALRGFIRP